MPVQIPSARVSLEGMPSSMKTSTAMTAPYPSVLFAFDGGFERALYGKKAEYWAGLDIHVVEFKPAEKYTATNLPWRGHDITIIRLPRPIQTDPVRKVGYIQLWGYFNNLIALAAGDREYLKSVVVDTMTLARETRADAHLQNYQEHPVAGAPMRTNLIQIEYGVINDAIKDIYLNFEETGINLIALHHLVEERKDTPVTHNNGTVTIERLPTGNMILAGAAKTYQFVDMALRMELVQDKDPKTNGTVASSKAKFVKSGYNPDLLDLSLPNITWNSLMGWVEMSLGGNLLMPKSQIAP